MSTIKKDLNEIIQTHIYKNLTPTYDEALIIIDVLNGANVDQLWSIYRRFVLRDEAFKILDCDPKDRVAISYANMYIGIEPDGYLHS